MITDAEALRAALKALVDAYIHKHARPDVAPGYRYRTHLAVGFDKYTDNLTEARAAVLRAAGLEPGWIALWEES